jgi:hypothetical protein
MKQSELIALDYRLKHAKSKKAVLKAYRELIGKTVSQVRGVIAVNIMLMTGKDLKEQSRIANCKRMAVRRKHG